MGYSFARVLSIAVLVGISTQAQAYSLKDMHELLWYMFRQHPNGVEAIYDHDAVLLPPQENQLVIPKAFTTGDYTVIVPVLWQGQWFAAITRFRHAHGNTKRYVTFYQTTRALQQRPIMRFGAFSAQVRNTRKVDADGSASGPIIAQFILMLFSLTDSYNTVEHMRSWQVNFLQRRRELMSARRNVMVLEQRQNESGIESIVPPLRAAAILALTK